MITTGMMYWLTRLDYIHTTAIFGLVLSVLLLVLLFMCWASTEGSAVTEKDMKELKTWRNRGLVAAVISVAVICFVPTTKQMAAIYIVPAVSQNEDVQKMFKDVPSIMSLGTEWLKETIQESVDEKRSRHGHRTEDAGRV